jgi:hypothetical protein
MRDDSITIDARFCGPPRSGNGGYVCGRIASRLAGPGPVAVRLKAPPPIDRAMRVEVMQGGVRLLDGEAVIAEARAAALELEVPACPSFEQALRASERYLGFDSHNFPGCFVCGPERGPGDGLRIFPGSLEGSGDRLAATWTPDASLADASGIVGPEFIWAALDCPGAFTRYPLAEGIALVLGELAVAQVGLLGADEPCILTAWSLGENGRRRHAGTALFQAEGRLVAKARAVWVEVPAQDWG